MIILKLLVHCFLTYYLFSLTQRLRFDNLLKFKEKKFPSIKNAKALYAELMTGINHNNVKSKNIKLSRYKIYTELVENLIKNAIQFGTPIHSHIPEIKKALLADIQLERKIWSCFIGGIGQIVIVSILGFVFQYFTQLQLERAFDFQSLILFVCLQFMGVISFTIIFLILRHKHFFYLEIYLSKLYLLRSKILAQIPLAQTYSQLNPDNLSSKGELKYFNAKIVLIFESIKKFGHIENYELELIIQELWQQQEFVLDKFSKELNGLKLLILCCFSLGGYLLLVMQSFEGFML